VLQFEVVQLVALLQLIPAAFAIVGADVVKAPITAAAATIDLILLFIKCIPLKFCLSFLFLKLI
jgi:hypothetical protein